MDNNIPHQGRFDQLWQKLVTKYSDFLAGNINAVTQAEQWMKVGSYIVAGRISKEHSTTIAELTYSVSNLLRLLHDYLLRRHLGLEQDENKASRIEMFLSVVECLEVFIEISTRRYTDLYIKWIAIFAIQVTKAVGRLILLFRKSNLLCFPFVKRLDRKALVESMEEPQPDSASQSERPKSFFTTSTGRRIRSLNAGSQSRLGDTTMIPEETPVSRPLSRIQMSAECLHICQPLIHLFSMGVHGQKSWIPWILSLGVDMLSLQKLKQSKFVYTKAEKEEMSRRSFLLLMYLLRSPFFDNFTKYKIVRFLSVLSYIPGFSYITEPAKAYLPEWQQTYFYTWST